MDIGAGEIVKNVIFIEPNNPQQLADTIFTLLKDSKLRESLGEEGKKEVQKWSWDYIASQTHSLYLKLMGKEQHR